MKRLLIAVIALCALASVAGKRWIPPQPAAGGGGGGTTLKDDWFNTSEGFENFGTDSTRVYLGTYFVAGSSYNITRVDLALKKVGSPTFTVTVEIRGNTANAPGTVLATSSTTISASTLTTGELPYTFDIPSTALTSGTTYWVVVKLSTFQDYSNYIQWSQISGSYPGYSMTQKSGNGTSWSSQANVTCEFQTYAP
jgi:hypothetical protein